MCSVVIIDDDVDSTETMHEFFDLENVPVLACGYDGKDAVQLYKKHNPDIVLLDLDMPKFDGYYAVIEIKKINPDAKIIVLTGVVEEKFLGKLEGQKKLEIIYKPYDLDEVVNRIKFM